MVRNNLGLDPVAGDEVEFKTNYLSIRIRFRSSANQTERRQRYIDYRGKSSKLNELNLD